MSRPAVVMNSRNSSRVTALVDIANGRPMTTQCSGLSNEEEPLSVPADPCLNRPAGSTVKPGQVGQSRNTVPGLGATAEVTAGTVAGAGARCTKNQTANTSTRITTPAPAAGAIARGFQDSPRLAGAGFAIRAARSVFAARSVCDGAREADCRATNDSIFATGAVGDSVARCASPRATFRGFSTSASALPALPTLP